MVTACPAGSPDTSRKASSTFASTGPSIKEDKIELVDPAKFANEVDKLKSKQLAEKDEATRRDFTEDGVVNHRKAKGKLSAIQRMAKLWAPSAKKLVLVQL